MPVYNGVDFIRQSLPPLLAMVDNGQVLEVVVVDDSSTDATAEVAAQMGARVLPSGGRLGPGGARNQAAESALGDILWFIDADVVLHANAATRLLEAFALPDVVAVFGSYDDSPAAQDFFSQYKNLVHHYYHQQGSEEAKTFWSGCGAVRKAAFISAGGFDVERFKYPSIEDIELGHRLLASGGRILLRRDILSTHLKVWRLGNLLHTEIFRRAIPWSRLLLGGGEFHGELNVGRQEQARAILAGGFALLLLGVLLGCVSGIWILPAFVAVLLANWSLYDFFVATRGGLFALGGVLFHQVYYLYSSASFAWVVFEQVVARFTGRGSSTAGV